MSDDDLQALNRRYGEEAKAEIAALRDRRMMTNPEATWKAEAALKKRYKLWERMPNRELHNGFIDGYERCLRDLGVIKEEVT